MTHESSLSRIGMRVTDAASAHALQLSLLRRGFLCDNVESDRALMDYCNALSPEAVLLELQAGHALSTVRDIRQSGYRGPLVTLVPAISGALRVELLRAGADDAIDWPQPVAQVILRLDFIMQAYLGENRPSSPAQQLQAALTPTELRIFEVLSQSAPDPVSREAIAWAVKRQRIAPDDRTIDVYISHIRRKFRLINAPGSIETVRGRGFRYAEAAQEDKQTIGRRGG